MNDTTNELQRLLEKIKNSSTLVIVEGKKDRIALQKFGISNITELSKKPLFQIVEEIASCNDECVILTDLDRKGRELYGRLSKDLQKHGVRIDNELREFMFKNTKLRQIEGITTYFEQ